MSTSLTTRKKYSTNRSARTVRRPITPIMWSQSVAASARRLTAFAPIVKGTWTPPGLTLKNIATDASLGADASTDVISAFLQAAGINPRLSLMLFNSRLIITFS